MNIVFCLYNCYTQNILYIEFTIYIQFFEIYIRFLDENNSIHVENNFLPR